MKPSPDYAVGRIDQWFDDKFQRKTDSTRPELQVFSGLHGMLELLETFSALASRNLHDGVVREYIDPIPESFRPVKDFVERVRTQVGEIFPDDLSTGDIDQHFADVFGNAQCFLRMIQRHMDSMQPFRDILAADSASDNARLRSTHQAYVMITGMIDQMLPDINKIVRLTAFEPVSEGSHI